MSTLPSKEVLKESPHRKPWYRILYIQVLVAVALGILVGHLYPDLGKQLKPLGDGFVKLIKMIIAPIIFCTIVHGIASTSDKRKFGRVSLKTLVYFEIVSTLALLIGLAVVLFFQPGTGFNIDPATLDPKIAHKYLDQSQNLTVVDFLLNLIPESFFAPFSSGNLLQTLLIASLTGVSLSMIGEPALPVLRAVDTVATVIFSIMRIVVRIAPIGAFGAMAFTVGSYGIGSLNKLVLLIATFYLTSVAFIVIVLGIVAKISGFSIFRFLAYIKEELLLVLGTSSSETALPGMINKMEGLGCTKQTVGLVIPLGYSFNLDGTNIYMTLATIFLAQATNTHLDAWQIFVLLGVSMLSSKGASGVTGAGFITLAATLAVVPTVPIESLAILVGIDRFMSECRAITNMIGNGVATVAISRWENEVSAEEVRANLERPRSVVEAVA
ncbi:aerobic C4-dicarboxylate transport protein [Verrucomicrobium sp. GAS474]|uniref:dicarboxylate/amino acid:cation symporter n=1 Tax=Verrucomicrobium sp. GAS474 TaxID=1882831 RepID=UPI00087974CE|nr:dicarboxylate/amino acid:cation symporter [Verrucomicrobium sp. GAS474]SDU22459.1 aerobic C4-dicarboxylate transport protein [Verrucomicrobium sp. GAS474]